MNEEFKVRINEWAIAQKDALVHDLMDLVRVPSVSEPDCETPRFGKGCRDVLDLMLAKGRGMGLTGTEYDGFAGSLSLDGAERERPEETVGIWCHLDVVPAGEDWRVTQPFVPVYRDGLVTGRGAQDNKSAAAMGLYLLKGLKELDIRLKKPLALYFGVSEECGMKDLDGFLARFPAPGLSLIADCGFPACCGEKGDLNIVLRGRTPSVLRVGELKGGEALNIIPGTASAVLEDDRGTHSFASYGCAGHSAFPAGSENALTGLLAQILGLLGLPERERALLAVFQRLTKETDGSTAGIALADGTYGDLTCAATVLGMTGGCWELYLDIRFPCTADPAEIFEKVRAFAERQGITAEQTHLLPAFGFAPEHKVIQTLTGVYNREQGTHAQPYTIAGGTYAAKLPNAVPYGISLPDKSAIRNRFPEGHGDYHQPDESVEADAVVRALYLYIVSVIELDELL